MASRVLLFLILFSVSGIVNGISTGNLLQFLDDFIVRDKRLASILSYLKLTESEQVLFSRKFSNKQRYAAFHKSFDEKFHDIYLADLNDENTFEILRQAADNDELKYPARWILFQREDVLDRSSKPENTSEDIRPKADNIKDVANFEKTDHIASKLASIYTAINTEIYIALEYEYDIHVYLVYKIRKHMQLIWEEYGVWNQQSGFDRSPPKDAISMRRRNLHRINMTAIAYMINNSTFDEMPHYKNGHVDIVAKFTYYLTIHLFDWLNVTGTINTTTSFGYKQANGLFDGLVQELAEGRSEFSASFIFAQESRMKFVHFIFPPTKVENFFIFKKPPLATIANIYALPFSRGVWMSIIVLIIISTLALGVTTLWEMITTQNQRLTMTMMQRLSQNFHDTLCLVFQQGISNELYSSSARQVLLLGLMSFMFLYTAYSANVVALLQSATNEINSVETLLKSPLQCGTEDVIYNRRYFNSDTRPLYRTFWMKKAASQGEGFFLSTEEGIRRVRKGLYAFHVEPSSAYYYIQKTFLEHEKCNLAMIRYFSFSYPHLCTGNKSPSKEQIRIGILRVMESGLQSRSNRRLILSLPDCGAGAAMFTPVSILYVTPIFQYLLLVYGSSLLVLAFEVYVHWRQKKRAERNNSRDDYNNDNDKISTVNLI